MNGQTERQAIAAKIRALLAKTVDKGCTEAEAMMAAAKAKELMDAYEIDLTEAELEADGFVRGTAEGPEKRRINFQNWIAMAIAEFCEVKCWGSGKRTVFFGLRSDVEFANWLLKALESFIWAKADEFGGDYMQRRTFGMGCASRIAERLRAEAAARKRTQAPSGGRALVVVKQAMVQREFAKLGIKLRGGGSRSYTSGGRDAYAAGKAAGDRASFGRPVNGGGKVLTIGR